MNEYDRNSLEYQVIMHSFQDQISDKQIILQNLIYEANQKVLTNTQTNFNKKQQDKQLTVQIIKLCRKNIQQIQSMFANVHSYFIDLKLEFVYNFFVGTFRNMVMIYKLLSQKFITVIKAKKNKQQQQSQPVKTPNRNTQRMIQQIKNKNINQIQYLDKIIKSIDLDEVQLLEKKKVIENRLFFQKKCLQTINPSDAVNQLQTLKKQIDRIILCSVRLIDDEEPLKNQYNRKIMENINNNFNIQQQICKGISMHTRQIFIKKMKDIAKKFKINIRQQFREEIIRQINDAKLKIQSIQIQTQPDPRFSSRDKNNYILQNQQLKKLKQSYRKQLIDLNKQLYRTQQQLKYHEKQLQISTQLMNKKTNQLQRLRKDYQHNLRIKDQTIQLINKDLIQTKNQYENKLQNLKKQQKITHKEGSENYGEESFVFDQSILADQVFLGKLKNISMKTHRNSFFYQREFKASKQQNQSLRKSLYLMLDVLKQQQLIGIDTINDLNQYLRLGKLPEKIQLISNELKRMMPIGQAKQIQESQIVIQTTKKSKNRSIIPHTYVFVTKEEKATQTNENMKSKSRTGHRISQKNKATENMQKNKLQFLKQQLMKKISSNDKKNKRMQHTRRSRLYLHQIDKVKIQESQKNQINFSMQNFGTIQLAQKQHVVNSKRPSRNKSIFNRKDMSFQSYRFNRQEIKPKIDYLKKLPKKGYNHIQNPTQNNTKKLNNNKSYEFDNVNIQQNKKNDSIIKIQRYQGANQIKNIMNLIESTDNKDNCYKNILKKLLQELNKLKKTQIMGQILQQINKKKHFEQQYEQLNFK